MPINKGEKINPGEICENCIHLRPAEGVPPCPWGNSQWADNKSVFVGEDRTPGSLCGQFKTYEDIGIEANTMNMKKQSAKTLKDSELNITLYRKIRALDEKNQKKLFKYWEHLFPSEYAEDMVTDDVETKARHKEQPSKHKKIEKERKPKNKFEDLFGVKEKS